MNKLYYAFAFMAVITLFTGCKTDSDAAGKEIPKGNLKVYTQFIADATKASAAHDCAEAARLCQKAKDLLKDYQAVAKPQIAAANKIAEECKAAPIKKDTVIKVVTTPSTPQKTTVVQPIIVAPSKPEDNASCKATWTGISKIYAKDKAGGLSAAEKDGLRETIERYKGFGCTEHVGDANAILSAIR
jgi:hypothetical protein